MANLKKKTNKAFAKRYKKTPNGKILAKHGGKKHLNAKMSSDVKRKLRKNKVLKKANTARIKLLLA